MHALETGVCQSGDNWMNDSIKNDDLVCLTNWDTPTICNAIEELVPERRGHGFTIDHLFALDPDLPPVCGYARTATVRAAKPSGESAAESMSKRAAYYEYIAKGQAPRITIIQDLDQKPGTGAFWGEVQTTIHKALGVVGAVTNGSFRDLRDSASGFNLLGGKVGPSHAFVHLVDIGCKVTVNGMTVSNDDIVHADQHGAVVVPPKCVKKIPEVVQKLIAREALILKAARKSDFCVEKLMVAIGDAADIH